MNLSSNVVSLCFQVQQAFVDSKDPFLVIEVKRKRNVTPVNLN